MTVSRMQSRRSLLGMLMRLSATLLALVLFALLTCRIVHEVQVPG
jgi:hypothetical protein